MRLRFAFIWRGKQAKTIDLLSALCYNQLIYKIIGSVTIDWQKENNRRNAKD